jgi:hypothetical protein
LEKKTCPNLRCHHYPEIKNMVECIVYFYENGKIGPIGTIITMGSGE